MIVSTTETIPGRDVAEILGLVTGNIVQSRNIGRDIQAGLKGLVGGNVGAYTDLLSKARDQATWIMIENARKLDADAVVNVRYTTSSISQGMSEVLAYGTAVRLR